MSEPEGNGSVRYSVKELLGAIDKKLDTALAKLETKAERVEVAALSQRVDKLEDEGKISRLLANNRESEATTRETRRDRGLTRFQAVVVIASSLISTVALVVSLAPSVHL